MLASTLGVEFDEDESWTTSDSSGKSAAKWFSRNITQSTIVSKHGNGQPLSRQPFLLLKKS